jgi:hypothetical protein
MPAWAVRAASGLTANRERLEEAMGLEGLESVAVEFDSDFGEDEVVSVQFAGEGPARALDGFPTVYFDQGRMELLEAKNYSLQSAARRMALALLDAEFPRWWEGEGAKGTVTFRRGNGTTISIGVRSVETTVRAIAP